MHATSELPQLRHHCHGLLRLLFVVAALAALSVNALQAQQTCAQLPKGVIGWWPGDGTAADLTLASHNGTLVNGATFAAGVDGQAFSFDGANDRVDIPDAPALRPTQFTLMAWVKLNAANANSCIICKQYGSGTLDSYSLWVNNGVLRGGMFGFVEAAGASPLPVQRFIQTAVTYDGSIIRLYLDGQIIAIAAGPTSAVPYDANQVVLGAEDNGVNSYTGFLNGLIDEAQIFGRALSGCEIRAMHRARAQGECKGDFDADAFPDFQDNCPAAANAGQQDADVDGVGDACDCAPADPGLFSQPGDYPGLLLEARDTLSWCEEPSITGPSTVYDVIRGNLGEFPVGSGSTDCRSRCLPPVSGLVAWWPGDGSASGLVGGVNGTLQNGATYASGLVLQSFSFDGIDDRVQTGALSLGATFSVAAWVNPALVNEGGLHRIVENSFASGFYLGVTNVGTGYKFIVKSLSSPYGAAQGGTITPGKWQFVVGTYNGATGTLYVDGSAVAADAFPSPGTVNLPVYIGAYYGGGLGWKGQIDEVQVYDRALSAAEVRTLYDSGSAGQCKLALGGADASWTTAWATDGAIPAAGHGFWYLFLGRNSCGSGTYGFATGGAERVSTACN